MNGRVSYSAAILRFSKSMSDLYFVIILCDNTSKNSLSTADCEYYRNPVWTISEKSSLAFDFDMSNTFFHWPHKIHLTCQHRDKSWGWGVFVCVCVCVIFGRNWPKSIFYFPFPKTFLNPPNFTTPISVPFLQITKQCLLHSLTGFLLPTCRPVHFYRIPVKVTKTKRENKHHHHHPKKGTHKIVQNSVGVKIHELVLGNT